MLVVHFLKPNAKLNTVIDACNQGQEQKKRKEGRDGDEANFLDNNRELRNIGRNVGVKEGEIQTANKEPNDHHGGSSDSCGGVVGHDDGFDEPVQEGYCVCKELDKGEGDHDYK